MKRQSLYIFALMVLALTGCQKNDIINGQGSGDRVVKYAIDFGNSSFTKGELVNTTGNDNKDLALFSSIVGEFTAKAYDAGGAEKVSQTVRLNSGNWEATPETIWPRNTSLSFLAYANLPAGQTVSIASSGVSMSHTVPATAGNQTDILFGHYQGDGGVNTTAEIRFEHPLTAIRFQRGEIDDDIVIKSIRLINVAGSGNASMAPDGAISWSNVNSYSATVSQNSAAGLNVNSTSKIIGDTFIIIPQNLSGHQVTVSVTLGVKGSDTTATATLSSGEWKKGYTYTYKLSYIAPGIITASLTDYLHESI